MPELVAALYQMLLFFVLIKCILIKCNYGILHNAITLCCIIALNYEIKNVILIYNPD